MSGTERMENPNAPKHQPMPDCMMPDGAEPCAGFRYEAEARNNERASNDKLRDENERLRAALHDGAQRVIDMAPRDGKTDATAYFQLAVDLAAAAGAEQSTAGEKDAQRS